MRYRWMLGLAALLLPVSGVAAETHTQTILFIRHGEKPPGGLGQLSCTGLNRALALPAVLKRKYGRIDAVYAPNPAQQKPDGKGEDDAVLRYDYVRPLATVEPSAIAFDLPVHTEFGYSEKDKLKAALLAPAYRDATVLVGWEHHALNEMVPEIVESFGGDAARVTKMERKDFDLIWRLTIRRDGDRASISFAADKQGLDGRPEACPNP